MKIELKRIVYSERMSEETNCFIGDLYVEGKKVGEAKNDGRGGATHYYATNDSARKLIREAEAYCQTLPPLKFQFQGYENSLNMNLEHFIDGLLEEHLKQKQIEQFLGKIVRASKKEIIASDNPESSYRSWPLKMSIENMLAGERGEIVLSELISKFVVPNMKENEKILNTNIPEKVLRNAGLKEHQYVEPLKQATKQKLATVTRKTKRKI